MILNEVNFEEKIKQKTNKSLVDIILEELNRIYDAKLSGTLRDDEFSKEIMSVGKLFSNFVKINKKTEDEVDSFETPIRVINEEAKIYTFEHKNLKAAFKYVEEQDTFALLNVEDREKLAQPVPNVKSFGRAA